MLVNNFDVKKQLGVAAFQNDTLSVLHFNDQQFIHLGFGISGSVGSVNDQSMLPLSILSTSLY